jgi:starch synthase (maltosyl-transferring)
MPLPKSAELPRRILIQDVRPQVDCGRYAVKAVVGDRVCVSATIIRDGHEVLGAAVRFKSPAATRWRESPLEPVGNDRYEGGFGVDEPGRWSFRIEAWHDRVASYRWEVRRKHEAGQADFSSELAEGALLLGRESLTVEEALAAETKERSEKRWSETLPIDVDRERGAFGSWYELFPRSWGGFAGVERVLPQLAELGFDVVYLPPVHPIGVTSRKGRNNTLAPEAGDVGSPWAIGGVEGGHTAVHPDLGTLADFERLVEAARANGLEIALDFAIQCSPDHPWLREHPEWFHRRPDGTLKYAENPPKRYQDIYNVNFASESWRELWQALLDSVLFWVARGVKAFRVDNPHTKPVPFWEWLIGEVRREDPDVVFLSEAFTAPAMMTTLAKIGFTQSYTYFTWKNTRWELTEFVEQLLSWRDFYRPNLFVNTPDILHAYLQEGGRPAFEVRLVLAATLGGSYGIYSGFEHCENIPVREGSEEYLDSEKYEVKRRALDGELLPLVKRLNEIRRENPALQRFGNVTLLETDGDHLFAYAKRSGSNVVVAVVNTDPFAVREGVTILPASLGLAPSFGAEELLSGDSFVWQTGRNYVKLPPGGSHVLKVGR